MSRVFLVVHGTVQGVGYRHFVRGVAAKFGIRGFVKNIDDGSVEILAISNDENAIQSFKREIDVDARNGPQVFKIEENGERLKEFEAFNSNEFSILS